MEIRLVVEFECPLREATDKLVTGNDSMVRLRSPFSVFYLTYDPPVEGIIRETTVYGKKIYLVCESLTGQGVNKC